MLLPGASVRATGTDDYTPSSTLQPFDRLPLYASRMLCPCQQRRVSLLSPPRASPAVARSAWLCEKVTVVHRTGRNGVRSIARLALLRSSLRNRSAAQTRCLRMPRYRRISYRLIFSYSVERSMPRATAASFTFPLLRSSAASIISFSISSMVASGGVQL